MSQQTTFSQPPEPLTSTPSRVPAPLSPEAQADLAESVRQLRAELAATSDAARQARLLTEVGELQERAGDEPAATRDYLAAYSADSAFHEPLEGLVRLLEKRRSLRNLGRLVDALVAAAGEADEKVRAFLMRAFYLADVAGNPSEAIRSVRDALAVENAPAPERASAWLALEVLAGRTGEGATREEALGERVAFAAEPTWRALLFVDRARLRAAEGDVEGAVALAQQARATETQATWIATTFLEGLLRERPGDAGTEEARTRRELHASILESIASQVQQGLVDPKRGDELGVPLWIREPARMIDAWMRAGEARRVLGQLSLAAEILERAAAIARTAGGDDGSDDKRLAEAAVSAMRIRIAERMGDTNLAGEIAARCIELATDAGRGAALSMRVAEQAAADGDTARALVALGRAIDNDPGCLPARALQLDMLANGGDPGAYAAQLEAFAEHFGTDEARSRAFILAAYVWAVRAGDGAGAKAALSQAAMYGTPPATIGRLARSLASLADDAPWYEEATKRLLAAGSTENEVVSLYVELVRLRLARGDADAVAKTLREMGSTPRGAWLARVLEAFAPAGSGTEQGHARGDAQARGRAALEELAAIEADADVSRGLSFMAAMRAHAAGDVAGARTRLRELADRDAADVLVATYLADLDRGAGDPAAAARVASDAAAAATDKTLAAALRLEAGFERWRGGDRVAAIEEMEAAVAGAPEAAGTALAWAAWGVEPDSLDARRRALESAEEHGEERGDRRPIALERFALEIAAEDPEAALASLIEVDDGEDDAIAVAGALGRLAWSGGAHDLAATRAATARIAARGEGGLLLAAVEHVRLAREAHDAEALVRETRGWVEAGGGLPAAL
ncbi:MAG TPA: hypothetical protein VHV30_03935, partial [Polyangiaceae bacterium]|nr:hypothetical protein [Polyangiaceae bacterium]